MKSAKAWAEDKLVNFETAKLAKEKGYPQIWGCGTTDKGLAIKDYYTHDGYLNGACNRSFTIKFNGEITYDIDAIVAPTQTSLIRWLKDIKGLFVEVFVDDDSDEPLTYNIHRYFYHAGWECVYGHHGNYFKMEAYEEAIEAGLIEALNMI